MLDIGHAVSGGVGRPGQAAWVMGAACPVDTYLAADAGAFASLGGRRYWLAAPELDMGHDPDD
jgi:hypothetical protein